MQPVVTDGLVWSVGLSVRIASLAKTDERIEIPFEVWTWVVPRNHVLNEVYPLRRCNFEGTGVTHCNVRVQRRCGLFQFALAIYLIRDMISFASLLCSMRRGTFTFYQVREQHMDAGLRVTVTAGVMTVESADKPTTSYVLHCVEVLPARDQTDRPRPTSFTAWRFSLPEFRRTDHVLRSTLRRGSPCRSPDKPTTSYVLHCVEVLPAGVQTDDDVKYLVRRVDASSSSSYYTCVQFVRRSPEAVQVHGVNKFTASTIDIILNIL